MSQCFKNKSCRDSLVGTLTCMGTHPQTNFTAQTACMVPDEPLRDQAFNCMIEQHHCIVLPKNNPHYPQCRDSAIKGDPQVNLQTIGRGEWYKVHSWKLGEPIECMQCQKAVFHAQGTTGLVFNSTWHERNFKGELSPMNVVATMTTDPTRGPGKLFNTGEMFGLTYWEPYTIVKDGSREKEPFVLFYVCGGTLQGNYTTAFAVGRSPTLTPTLHTRLAGIIEGIGMKDSDFCQVDNSCFAEGGL